MISREKNSGIFTAPDGKSYLVTFALVSSLFLLWGFCNGMIDVMDKHFQKELHLTLAQSAWVQFAHYLGYFLMAMPAGWLANRLGYKGGIIAGLLMVAVGGFWFIPATKIATFPAFLSGVCVIASGLTFLETVANPYSTVLGPKRYAATRINLAQSCNGIGWILGPIAGAQFFYGQDAMGKSTGSQTLWIPYAAVGGFVLVLAIIFSFCKMPDIVAEDEPNLDAKGQSDSLAPVNRAIALSLIWLNVVILSLAVGMILSAIVAVPSVGQALGLTESQALFYSAGALLAVGSLVLAFRKHQITHQSLWGRPHFSGATLTQFFYVAAQCGIFAYFINYMTSQVPAVPDAWRVGAWGGWFEIHGNGLLGLSDQGASTLASIGFGLFLAGRFMGAALLKKFPAHRVLATFAMMAAACSLVVFFKLGWASVVALFLSYFFMSIMFPTIFALGIHGLGDQAKKASSFIVMAIMGGAIMPKLMGHIADTHRDGMSAGFVVPLVCFIWVAAYACFWSKLSGTAGIAGATQGNSHG
jgi:FHS family L-fucose permease-like MFS transporter